MIILIPAYGRKYSTAEEALKDWHDGKDFKIAQGPYTSVRDFDLLKHSFKNVVIYIGSTAVDVESPDKPLVI